jgi:hypothetical protein
MSWSVYGKGTKEQVRLNLEACATEDPGFLRARAFIFGELDAWPDADVDLAAYGHGNADLNRSTTVIMKVPSHIAKKEG